MSSLQHHHVHGPQMLGFLSPVFKFYFEINRGTKFLIILVSNKKMYWQQQTT